MFMQKFGETPKTKFKSLYNHLDVAVRGPRMSEVEQRLAIVLGSTWADSVEEAAVLGDPDKLYEGTALWQGLEYVQFFISISGVSRIFTHQLVRMRIGATYSQQCSGDADWRHHDAFVPKGISEDPNSLKRYMMKVAQAKVDYAHLVDSRQLTLHEARYELPHCLDTFITMNVNLAALVPWYHKRVCTQSNTLEMVLVALRVRDQIIRSWPKLTPLFKPDRCETGSCFWANSVKHGDADSHTNLFKEGGTHPEEFATVKSLYSTTNLEQLGKPMPPRYVLGLEEVASWD